MKRALGVALALGLFATRAEAAGKSACFDGAVKGQELRNANKLVAARQAFIECAKPSCPQEVATECSRWLVEVNDAIPTVVFGLRDAKGVDVQGVHLFVDGEPVGSSSDGTALRLDPGSHSVRFVRDDGSSIDKPFVARAGEKNRAVVAELTPPPASTSTPTASPPPPPPPGRRVPTATWALGGVGVAALGVFGVFGALGVSQRSDRHCDVGCNASDKDSVDGKFLVADIGLVVGVAALAGAAVFYFLQPKASAAAWSSYFDRERNIWK